MDLEEYGQLGIHVVVYGIYENLRWKRQDKSFRGSAQRGLNLRKRRNGGKKRNVRNDAVDKRQARRFAVGYRASSLPFMRTARVFPRPMLNSGSHPILFRKVRCPNADYK